MAAACWVLVAFLWVQCSSAACSLPAPRIGVVSKIIVDSVAGGANGLAVAACKLQSARAWRFQRRA